MSTVYLSQSTLPTFKNSAISSDSVSCIIDSAQQKLESKIQRELKAAKWKSAIKRRRRYF